jgi:hypothetical protein
MKNLFFIFAIIIIAVVIAKESFWKKTENYEPVACTMDAKMCPDGSYVGRTGPKCEFQACPDMNTNTIAAIDQTVVIANTSITPIELVEDSRCPIDVQCIQAGTVRVKVRMVSEGDLITEAIIGLSSPANFDGKVISLKSVTPKEKNSKVEIGAEQYKFEFSVSKQ